MLLRREFCEGGGGGKCTKPASMGSSKRQRFPGCRSQAAWPFVRAVPSQPGGVGQREGGTGPLCPWRARHAAGHRAASLPRPLPKPAETPGACSARRGGGSAPPASVPWHPPKAPPQSPMMGVPKATTVIFFPPCGCRDPTPRPTRPGGGQGPCQGERLPSPLPPLTLFGWTEGCLGESFSTLFHIHNGLNIGEQSGTWRAKPSPWSEPMTSPPR